MVTIQELLVPDEIRACLGVDPQDIPDHYIQNSQFEEELEIEFLDWLTDYETILQTTGIKSFKLLKLFCRWYCAAEIAKRPLAFLQMRTDGKAAAERFSHLKAGDIKQEAVAQASKFQALLVKEQTNTPSTGTAAVMGVSRPDYNPVDNSTGNA